MSILELLVKAKKGEMQDLECCLGEFELTIFNTRTQEDVWDGDRFSFITDLMSECAIGVDEA